MAINITNVKLFMRDKDGEWVDVDLSNTIRGFCEDNYSDTVIIDEEWNRERLKEHMVDRAMDRVFVEGWPATSASGYKAFMSGYLAATAKASIAVSYFNNHFGHALMREQQGREQHRIRGLQGPVTANGNYGHLVKDAPALPSITKALLSRIK